MKILFTAILYIILFYSIFKIAFQISKRRGKKNLYKIIEIYFLEKQFKVDVKKIDINVLLNIVAICNAFVFTFVLIVTTFIDNLIIRQLATFVLLFPVIYIAYYIVSVYLKKKK